MLTGKLGKTIHRHCQRPPRACGRSDWSKFLSTNNDGVKNYYDSQSGMYVPIHNEEEVSAFLLGTSWDSSAGPRMQSFQQKGLKGIILTATDGTKDISPFILEAIRGQSLDLLLSSLLLKDNDDWISKIQTSSGSSNNTKVSVLFDYTGNTKVMTEAISDCIQQYNGLVTTGILCSCDHEHDAVEMASNVAQILDDTGGGDYLYVTTGTQDSNSDGMVQLCEELNYLDVPGPTMKARMIVDATHANMSEQAEGEEVVEECLMIGVNKFAIEADRLPWLAQLVQSQGKSCTFQTD